MAKGRLDQAIFHFKKALEIRPNFSPVKNNLGSAYLAKPDSDLAEQAQMAADDLLSRQP